MKKLLLGLMCIGIVLLSFGNAFGVFLMFPYITIFLTKKALSN